MSPGWEARARATIARLDAGDPGWRDYGILTTAQYLAAALDEVDAIRRELAGERDRSADLAESLRDERDDRGRTLRAITGCADHLPAGTARRDAYRHAADLVAKGGR